jgi:hypothetical protein
MSGASLNSASIFPLPTFFCPAGITSFDFPPFPFSLPPRAQALPAKEYQPWENLTNPRKIFRTYYY